MSTIKSSNEHLTLNADGSSKDIKFQANGVEKASISSAGAFTSTTIDATKLTGNLPAISGASLTGLPADATKAPLANPTFTGTVSKSGSSSGTAKIFKTASDASEIYLYIGTGATKFRKQDDSANTFEILPDGRGKSQFTAKVWCNFDGTGTAAIRDSHNVSSITDNGTGDFTVTFSNNMGNTNYCASIGNYRSTGDTGIGGSNIMAIAVGSIRFETVRDASTKMNPNFCNLLVFGD